MNINCMKSKRNMSAIVLVCLTSCVGWSQLAPRPLVSGREIMVTYLDPLASQAGMRILQQGGNAFDAAVATAAAVAVVDPRMSSVGGNGFATIYIARTHEVKTLNFYGTAPKGATVSFYTGKNYSRGALSAPVPSGLKGWATLHAAYGKLPWATVLQPAIDLALNGFVVRRPFSDSIAEERDLLSKYPTSAKVFLPNGLVPKPGEIFRQVDLAKTLQEIAVEGAEVFYAGSIADQIADFYRKEGGIITKDDLKSYQASWVTPISTTYHGYTFYTQPPSSSGIAVLEQLNLLENFSLKSLGHNSPEYLHYVGEAMRLAIADRNRYVGDPNFVNVPVAKLLSKEYARQRSSLIHSDSTMSVVAAGDTEQPVESHTTHLNTVDADGNMVALTQTLGAEFGSGVIVGNTGVLFSNEMRHLHLDPSDPSRLEPGKRSRSNESPIIVLKGDQPFMALGTPGNDGIWQRLVQVILNVVDFDQDIQTAITEPRMVYGGQQEIGTDIKPVFNVEDRISLSTIDSLRKGGYVIRAVKDDIGRVNGIIIDPQTGFRSGGADPREDGYVLGW
jgi:gamma-glutamyltranspeptidase/glutathione hydrolase